MNMSNTINNLVKVTLLNNNKLKIVAKQKDIQGVLVSLNKKIKKIKQNNMDLENQLLSLNKLFIQAARKSTVLAGLEEKLNVIKIAHENWIEAKDIQTKLSRFAKNKAASKAKKEIDSLVVNLEITKEKAINVLNKIARAQRPIQLTNKDPLLNSIIKYIESSFNELDGKIKPTIDPKKSKNMLDFGSKGEIRFARYIPIYNIPTIEGSKKNLYVVFVITLYTHKTRKGMIVPLTPKSLSPLSISLVATVIPPKNIPNLFQASSLRKAREILAFLSLKHSLVALLGESISSTPERRRLKVEEKLKILKDPKIKLEQNKTFFIVKIPKKDVPTLGNEPTNFEKELYTDMQRIAGLPATGRYNTDRLRVDKREQKGKYWEFTYRVLPMRPNKDMIKEREIVHPDDNKILSEELSDWMTTLKDEAKNWY